MLLANLNCLRRSRGWQLNHIKCLPDNLGDRQQQQQRGRQPHPGVCCCSHCLQSRYSSSLLFFYNKRTDRQHWIRATSKTRQPQELFGRRRPTTIQPTLLSTAFNTTTANGKRETTTTTTTTTRTLRHTGKYNHIGPEATRSQPFRLPNQSSAGEPQQTAGNLVIVIVAAQLNWVTPRLASPIGREGPAFPPANPAALPPAFPPATCSSAIKTKQVCGAARAKFTSTTGWTSRPQSFFPWPLLVGSALIQVERHREKSFESER